MEKRPTVAFHTLGCKVNQYDTDQVAGMFAARGYEVVPFDSKADVYVINTCTVTNTGDRKSRQIIRRAARANPDAVVAVMGCYSQVAPNEVARIEGVGIVLGTADRGKLLDLVEEARKQKPGRPVQMVNEVFAVEEFEEPFFTEYNSRTRATLKIQEGCNQFCTYCIVPYARGKSRSRAPEAVVKEAERLAARGFKEIVLTGIHLGAYGKDLAEGSLASLIARLHSVGGIDRIRISSIDSYEIDEPLLEVVAEMPKVCRHLHIPLQSGDDKVLRAMGRRYSTGEFLRTVDGVRERVPGIAVTTDVIVGFPGETEENFQNTLAFVKKAQFTRLHVFQFSRRRGTRAATMPGQVPADVKARRSQELIAVGRELAAAFHRRVIGQVVEVLAEQWTNQGGECEGLTDNYIRVMFSSGEDVTGRLVPVRIDSADADGAYGTKEGQ